MSFQPLCASNLREGNQLLPDEPFATLSTKAELRTGRVPERGFFFAFLTLVLPVVAQTVPGPAVVVTPELPARAWVESAAANELSIIKDDGKTPLRYRIHKMDSKEDITRR